MGCNLVTGVDGVEFDEPAVSAGDPSLGPGPKHLMNCAYSPAAPGVDVGMQLPSSLAWQGYLAYEPLDAHTTLNVTDLYDCMGTKGVHAIVFEAAEFA